jgi:hypothetical protein|tara:strand:- start:32107 stop:32928 length:822 start_codon:yes stop_codon:yes gene_type:complete
MKLPDYASWSAEKRHNAKIQGIFRKGDFPKLDEVFDDILPQCPALLEEVLKPYAGKTIQERLNNMYEQDTLPVFETAGYKVSNESNVGRKQLGVGNMDSWHAFNLIWNPGEAGKQVMEARMKKNRDRLPVLRKIIEKYEEWINVITYSMIAPNSVVLRHTGHENLDGKYLRLHFPLHIPEGDLFLEVNDEEIQFSEAPFAFNNQIVHSAHNRTGKHRLVMILDLYRPFLGIPTSYYITKLQDLTNCTNKYLVDYARDGEVLNPSWKSGAIDND